jgi:chaperonin GroES
MQKKSSSKTSSSNTKIKFRPVGDKVLIKPGAAEEKSPSGIFIPDTVKSEGSDIGTVVAIGEGKRNDRGDVFPLRVKVGDKVVFEKYSKQEVKVDDVEYFIVAENNILGIF